MACAGRIDPGVLGEVGHHAAAGEQQDAGGQHQHGQHGHLDFLLLDLLAEIFGRAADHQTGEKDGQDGIHQHAVETGADAAEDDFAELDVE